MTDIYSCTQQSPVHEKVCADNQYFLTHVIGSCVCVCVFLYMSQCLIVACIGSTVYCLIITCNCIYVTVIYSHQS